MATIWITGASSFTAFHLAHELTERGHHLILSCSRPFGDYGGIQAERLKRLPASVDLLDETPFGSERMLQFIQINNLDAFCHHGSWTQQLHANDFDLNQAISWNTRNVAKIMEFLAASNCQHFFYTNSYFVQSRVQPNAYALSKYMTGNVLELYANLNGLSFSSIILPNPVGPWDNTRLLESFFKCWASNQEPTLFVKDWVRDQIWVNDLSTRWVDWLEQRLLEGGCQHFQPSGQVQTLDSWIQQFQQNVQRHTGWACSYHSIHCPSSALQSMPDVLFNLEPLSVSRNAQADYWNQYIDHLEWRLEHHLL